MSTQLDSIQQGIQTLIGLEDLKHKLSSNKPLRIKLGVDPTRPDLTLGHMVVMKKLRQFQDLGHTAVLIIGDYTTTIGDPSGRSITRPALSYETVQENAKTYLDQAFKILNPITTEIRYNSEWFHALSFTDALNLTRKMTVARMLERDDFSKRYNENNPISIVELLYPLLQGYDSVQIQADVELGGNDQLFNMLVGRSLQKEAGQSEQAVICMPLLVGTDGVRKMSKSYDNYIALNDKPRTMFGKLMSINDTLMLDYYKYLLGYTDATLQTIQNIHPLEAKKQLAQKLLAELYNPEIAQEERTYFEQTFSSKVIPTDIPTFKLSELFDIIPDSLVEWMTATKLFKSKNEIRRLIEQSAVKVDGSIYRSNDILYLKQETSKEWTIQAGKRIFIKFQS